MPWHCNQVTFLALGPTQMEAELGGYSRDNKELNRQLEHMEIKVRVTQREIMKERQQVRCSTKEFSDRGCNGCPACGGYSESFSIMIFINSIAYDISIYKYQLPIPCLSINSQLICI